MTARNAYPQRGWRRIAARLGLGALLLQTLFPVLLAGILAAPPAHAWDEIVICTGDGLMTVSLNELPGSGQPQPEQAPHAPFCPACPGYFQAHAAITPPVVLAAAPGLSEIIRVRLTDQPGQLDRRFSPQSARAPPAFA